MPATRCRSKAADLTPGVLPGKGVHSRREGFRRDPALPCLRWHTGAQDRKNSVCRGRRCTPGACVVRTRQKFPSAQRGCPSIFTMERLAFWSVFSDVQGTAHLAHACMAILDRPGAPRICGRRRCAQRKDAAFPGRGKAASALSGYGTCMPFLSAETTFCWLQANCACGGQLPGGFPWSWHRKYG